MSFVRTCLRILRSLFPGRNSRDFENQPERPEAGVEHHAEQQAERLTVCRCKTYSPGRNAQRNTGRNTNKEVFKEGVKKERKRHTPLPADAGVCVSPKILFDIYQ